MQRSNIVFVQEGVKPTAYGIPRMFTGLRVFPSLVDLWHDAEFVYEWVDELMFLISMTITRPHQGGRNAVHQPSDGSSNFCSRMSALTARMSFADRRRDPLGKHAVMVGDLTNCCYDCQKQSAESEYEEGPQRGRQKWGT